MQWVGIIDEKFRKQVFKDGVYNIVLEIVAILSEKSAAFPIERALSISESGGHKIMVDLTRAITEDREFSGVIACMKEQCAKGGLASKRPLVAAGLCDGAEFAFINNLLPAAFECGYDGMLVIVSDEKKANRLCKRLQSYGKKAYVYLGRDLVLYSASASHECEHERLFVLQQISINRCDCVITTADAFLQYTIPRSRLEKMQVVLTVGESYKPEELVDRLERSGYHRAEIVESIGQYAVRGGILDIFSPSMPNPVRVDFFGEEIDRMCLFDVMTQRQIEDCPSFCLVPAKELIADDQAKKKLRSSISLLIKKCTDSRVKDRLSEELECIESERESTFLDKYISLIYPEKQCLLDYTENMLPVICEYGACLSQLEGKEAFEKEQVKILLEEGSIYGKDACFSKTAKDFEEYVFEDFSVLLSNLGSRLSGHRFSGMFSFRTKQTTGYGERFDLLCDDLRGYMSKGTKVKLVCENEISMINMQKMLTESGFGCYIDSGESIQRPATVALTFGQIIEGFELIADSYACLTEVTPGAVVKRSVPVRRRKKDNNLQKILSYADLSEGDFIVHDIHGIGQYLGMSSLLVEGVRKDFVKIKYAGSDMLYLPCGQLDKISKYIGKGAEDGNLKLSKMGGAEWKKVKYKAKIAAKDIAKQLIALYASRMKKEGIAFPKDDEMQREFENSFEYEETDCQLSAVEEVKRDMERKCPMDRLLCGDVGYGKTEVALRAAFKAVEGGFQVAILVPTTILCMQHYRTILSRMRGFPVSVDMISRFRTTKEIEESLRKLRRGETDIIVGTHRLLSKDVEFKKLGLLIIDEEQRFGVAHKEKLKEFSKNVDVLTLSATPIPRTLNMAMSGIRDMSVLDEAPVDRLPVQTFVLEYDEKILGEAIRRELRRGGQIFYLVNDIEKMPDKAAKLQKEFPDISIEVANGRMDKDQLSDIWEQMIAGEIDILVSTTIIETGVDVPNANTLIIENADRMGLSQLHQIRGRVGRSSRRAYAYFTYPGGKQLKEIPEKRLEAIRDFTEFGSGFRIAMRDMEIRGVGNLLGAEQHGHMESIGYDLYMKLLTEAVNVEKGIKEEPKIECTVELKIDAYIPESYLSNQNQRIDAYKKISLIETAEDLSDIYDEFLDRYGELPAPVLTLLYVSRLRALGSKAGMQKILANGGNILFYPEKFDAVKMSKMAAVYNGKLLITLSGIPYATLKSKEQKGNKFVKEAIGFLEQYLEITADV